MTGTPPLQLDPNLLPMFVDDETLRDRINPKIGLDRFRAKLAAKEKSGFPQVNTFWEGRYWRAVCAYLDDENGVRSNGYTATAEDGAEDFNAGPKRAPRLQAGPPSAAVLDRNASRSRPNGVSGSVHSLAARRK
jgi:hypothetical protein